MAATITIAGVAVKARVRVQGLTIHDILNDAPKTCTFVLEGTARRSGRRCGSPGAGTLLFAGPSRPSTKLRGAGRVMPGRGRDRRQRANPRRPFGTWVETSATTIAQAITDLCAGVHGGRGRGGPPPRLDRLRRLRDVHRVPGAAGDGRRRLCKFEDRVVYLFHGPHDRLAIRSTPRTGPIDRRLLSESILPNWGPASTGKVTASRCRPKSRPAPSDPDRGRASSTRGRPGDHRPRGRTARQPDAIAYSGVDLAGGGPRSDGAARRDGPGLEPVAGAGVERGCIGYADRRTCPAPRPMGVPRGPRARLTIGSLRAAGDGARAPRRRSPATVPMRGLARVRGRVVTRVDGAVAVPVSNAIRRRRRAARSPPDAPCVRRRLASPVAVLDVGFMGYRDVCDADRGNYAGPARVVDVRRAGEYSCPLYGIPIGRRGRPARRIIAVTFRDLQTSS